MSRRNRVLKIRSDLISILGLAAVLFWSLWPVLQGLWDRWSRDPRYAHGQLVPVFALALLWVRRDRVVDEVRRPSSWGLALIIAGAVVQAAGGYFRQEAVEAFSLFPYLSGIAVLWGGRRALSWAWLSIAFLAFMIPLPWRLENALGPPLQASATWASVFGLECLGFPVTSEGNIIQLAGGRIGVAEACSGLSMLMTFIALSTAVALVVERPLLDRATLVLSSIPVAWIANVARITLTGVLYETLGSRAADAFYHDLAGWLMIPFALILYGIEIRILSGLLIEEREAAPAAGIVRCDEGTGPRATAATA
ncbi:Transmembrane exosortase [Planctomyces sp. SH-PL62]|nr:Transmembrane exosortase [Planctomyces sp. SH-PL62]